MPRIVLDLKADALELLATLHAAAEEVRRQRGQTLPLQILLQFSPTTQLFWSRFDLLTRTDIPCGANSSTSISRHSIAPVSPNTSHRFGRYSHNRPPSR